MAFSPTYETMSFLIYLFPRRIPSPQSSSPKNLRNNYIDKPPVLETTVRFLVPASLRAQIRFSGMPHMPNPPLKMVAPSLIYPIIGVISLTIFEKFAAIEKVLSIKIKLI